MNFKLLLLIVLVFPLWSFSRGVFPPGNPYVFSAFRLGTPVKNTKKYLSDTVTVLSDGGLARRFSHSFTSLGNAIINEGVIVTYNDTIRAMLFKLDQVESTKLWNGMIELYGLPDASTVLDNLEWVIESTSFAIYERDGIHYASYRDIKWFEKMNIKHVILFDLDFL